MTGMNSAIRVTVGGDLCLDRTVAECVKARDRFVAECCGTAQRVFEAADLSIANLECSITTSGQAIAKAGPWLKTDPKVATVLRELGIRLVTLANNHIRDFGDAGIRETLDVCAKLGISTVGADDTLDGARRIFFCELKGRRLAVINVGESEFANATAKHGGANPLDVISVLSDIQSAKAKADHLLLIVHGGLEYAHYPSPESVRMLRFLAEQGPTAIIRHHPHCVQGYEVWKDVPIFYSVGNLLFDPRVKDRPGWCEGILVSLIIKEDDQCSFDVHPFYQCKQGPGIEMLDDAQKGAFFARFDQLCRVIEDPVELEREWRLLLNDKRVNYLYAFGVPNHFLRRICRRLNIHRYIRPCQRTRLLWEDYVRCEAHREALLALLECSREDRR